MDVTISKSHLCGQVQVPASKSFAHRQLIAAALSDKPTTIHLNNTSADIEATLSCIQAMGANIHPLSGNEELIVSPISTKPDKATLHCNESGSTLRFLLPVAAALGMEATFTGSGRLPERPNQLLIDAMAEHGVQSTHSLLPLTLSGKLQGGKYAIAGNVSSQYITGLLLALPLCKENSEIIFTTPLESAGYLDITCQVLSAFGICVEKTASGYHIQGSQRYQSPGAIVTEGDWSSAVFWYAANAMGHRVNPLGLNPSSCQGDRQVISQLNALGSTLNVAQTPDSLPALAVAACMHPGTTHFVGAERLRIKESDRIRSVCNLLTTLGQTVYEKEDGLIVEGGKPFTSGTVDGCNDHRIVMAAALAATCAEGPVTIVGAEAVNKSYPHFFSHLKLLGGNIHGQYPG